MQCVKNYFKLFLPQEAGVFGNNIEKEPQEATPKLEKMSIIYLQRIYAYLICSPSHSNASVQAVAFCNIYYVYIYIYIYIILQLYIYSCETDTKQI